MKWIDNLSNFAEKWNEKREEAKQEAKEATQTRLNYEELYKELDKIPDKTGKENGLRVYKEAIGKKESHEAAMKLAMNITFNPAVTLSSEQEENQKWLNKQPLVKTSHFTNALSNHGIVFKSNKWYEAIKVYRQAIESKKDEAVAIDIALEAATKADAKSKDKLVITTVDKEANQKWFNEQFKKSPSKIGELTNMFNRDGILFMSDEWHEIIKAYRQESDKRWFNERFEKSRVEIEELANAFGNSSILSILGNSYCVSNTDEWYNSLSVYRNAIESGVNNTAAVKLAIETVKSNNPAGNTNKPDDKNNSKVDPPKDDEEKTWSILKSFWKESKGFRIWVVVASLIIMILTLVTIAVAIGSTQDQSTEQKPVPTSIPKTTAVLLSSTPAPTVTPFPTTNPKIDKKIDEATKKAGWKNDDLKKGKDIDISKDKSTASHGSFKSDGARTPEEAINFLRKDAIQESRALMKSSMILSRAPKSEILDPANWSSGQSNIEFYYAGNTSVHDGIVEYAGVRKGYPGEIILFFASPTTGAVISYRGPCDNLQLVLPSPKDPSKDPAAKGVVAKVINDIKGPGQFVPDDEVAKLTSKPRVNPTPKIVVVTPMPTQHTATSNPTSNPSPEPGEGKDHVNTGQV